MADEPQENWERGWYEDDGSGGITYRGKGLRYWDGEDWTNQFIPPQSKAPGFGGMVMAVALGMVLGWLIVYVGAQIAPDDIYWPVKFVVEDAPGFN